MSLELRGYRDAASTPYYEYPRIAAGDHLLMLARRIDRHAAARPRRRVPQLPREAETIPLSPWEDRRVT